MRILDFLMFSEKFSRRNYREITLVINNKNSLLLLIYILIRSFNNNLDKLFVKHQRTNFNNETSKQDTTFPNRHEYGRSYE